MCTTARSAVSLQPPAPRSVAAHASESAAAAPAPVRVSEQERVRSRFSKHARETLPLRVRDRVLANGGTTADAASAALEASDLAQAPTTDLENNRSALAAMTALAVASKAGDELLRRKSRAVNNVRTGDARFRTYSTIVASHYLS